jgi:hypothetical protein
MNGNSSIAHAAVAAAATAAATRLAASPSRMQRIRAVFVFPPAKATFRTYPAAHELLHFIKGF